MTETQEKTVLFDPGYAQHTTILSINLEYVYSLINQFRNLGQRRTQFKRFYPQILKMVDNNIGFCLGCMLWAVYIKSEEPNTTIQGNPCLGGEYDEAEAVEEIDFSIEYYTQLQKDVKYYLSSNYEVNPLHLTILELYREFLTLNRGFVDTKTTDDIKLPKSILIPEKEKIANIHEKIQEVIKTGKLLDLTEVLELIYKG